MAKGDIKNDLQSIAAGAYLSIQPSTGIAWVVHNIYHADAISVELYDGTNSIEFISSQDGPGGLVYNVHHCTNSIYLRIKNEESNAELIAYDIFETENSKVAMALESIDAADFLDIRPTNSGDMWLLHNIYHEGTISVEYYDGTNQLEFVSNRAGADVLTYYAFGLTYSKRVRVKNEDGSAKLIGYSAVIMG